MYAAVFPSTGRIPSTSGAHTLNSLGKGNEARERWREAVEAAPELASLFGY